MLKRLKHELDELGLRQQREKRVLVDQIEWYEDGIFYEEISEYARHVPDSALKNYHPSTLSHLSFIRFYIVSDDSEEYDDDLENQLQTLLNRYNDETVINRLKTYYPALGIDNVDDLEAYSAFAGKMIGNTFDYNKYRSHQVLHLVRVLPKELVRMVRECF